MENTRGIATTLAATLVPDVNLDVYIYFKQLTYTTVPKNLIGLDIDIQIDSLAIWGVIKNDVYWNRIACRISTMPESGQCPLYRLGSGRANPQTLY